MNYSNHNNLPFLAGMLTSKLFYKSTIAIFLLNLSTYLGLRCVDYTVQGWRGVLHRFITHQVMIIPMLRVCTVTLCSHYMN